MRGGRKFVDDDNNKSNNNTFSCCWERQTIRTTTTAIRTTTNYEPDDRLGRGSPLPRNSLRPPRRPRRVLRPTHALLARLKIKESGLKLPQDAVSTYFYVVSTMGVRGDSMIVGGGGGLIGGLVSSFGP